MGADVSAERGRYTSQQKADFERKYREMYGENLSREELLERYRMEKLKAERKRRLEEAKAAQDSERRRRSDDEYTSRSHRRRDSRDRYDDRAGKQQNDNVRIIKQEHDRRQREYEREHRSHRSRGHRDDRKRQEHRSRHRRTSSKSRDRPRSSSSSSKDNRRNRKSSETMKSSEERDSRSKREKGRSPRHRGRDGRERSRRREDTKRSSRSRSKHVRADSESDSEDNKRDREEDSDRKTSKANKEKTSRTVRSKKRKNHVKAEHYKSAPDLTVDREYGKGPWGRAHDFFDNYEQRPQSWVDEIAAERNSVMPAPVMERQIIYSMPHIAPQVDGIGYPLSNALPFSSIPLQNVYNQQSQGRPHNVDLTAQEPPVQARAADEMQSAPTAVKIPAGAVPALGPNAKPKKVSKQKSKEEPQTKSSKSSQQRSRTLPPKRTSQPTGQTPSRDRQSASLPRSDGPTPKPRMRSLGDPKSPVPIQSVKVRNLSPNRSGHGKKQKGRITSFSAREDFESLLASDYGASNMMYEDLVGNYPTSYPGNYRPNQEIFVDDVIIRNHVPLERSASTDSDSDSEGVTDEEHVLTLGENLSPNSYGYSSGFDLEIPEGFTFDSDTSTNKGSPKRKKALAKSREKVITPTAVKPVYGLQGNHKSGKQQTLVLTSIEPIPRSKDGRKDKNPKSADKKSKTKRTTSTDHSSSAIRERAIPQNSATIQNTRQKHRHPSSPETHSKNTPSQSPGRKSRHSSQQSQNKHNSDQYEPQVYPTNASVQKSTRDLEGKGKRTNKRTQHPSKQESTERIITPSKSGWSSEKITHDIGVGTKPWKPELRSTAVQTLKKKQRPPQPPAQPIYFLKPISSQEVFIEDSSLVSHSETDMSRSGITPATSQRGRTATSYSGSSTMSPNTEYTEQSDVESEIPFQRNSISRVGVKKHTSSLSSTTSFDPEPVRVVQPAMKIGISETIQADHYTSSGGQVFFITRSRHGSPPASLKALTEDMKSIDEQSEEQRSPNATTQDPHQFDVHEVGKWVLDCYAQDQKLKSTAIQGEPTLINPPAPVNQVRLTKQSAVEYDASFTLPSPHEESPAGNRPTVVPLTEEALYNHNGNIPTYSSQSSKSSTEVTGDNIDIARQASDRGVFQQELVITKNKIKRFPERDRTPEPSWKSEKYQSKLNHWSTSPSGNVVLAEVCSVNDTEDTSSAVSMKSPTPEPVHVPSPQPQVQIAITKNTRVIRPNNNHRSRYTEETIISSRTAPTTHLHQGSQKVQGSVSSSSTDIEESLSLPIVPLAVHSQLNRQVGEPAHYSGVSSHIKGKPVTASPTRLNQGETPTPTVPYQSIQSRTQQHNEFAVASNIATQQNARPTSASSSQSRSSERQPLRKTPGISSDQQQQQAPEWSKKPSTTARSHNRQPYLEKIARASEVNSRQQAYQSSKPKVGSFESNTSKSSQQSDTRKLPPNSNPIGQVRGASRNHAQKCTGSEADGDERPTYAAAFPTQKDLGIGVSNQSSESETETTLSNSSEEVISPKRTLREALKTRGPYAIKPDEQSQSSHANNEVHSPMQNAPPNRNPTPGPRRSLSVGSQNSIPRADGDWRIVSQNNTATTPSHTMIQQNPTIPKATTRAKLPSVEDHQQISKSHTLPNGPMSPQQSSMLPRYQRMNTEPTQRAPYTASKSTAKSYPDSQLNHQEPILIKPHKSSTSSDERDNPFNAMDEEEISSIVEKIPGRKTTATRSGSESDIMEKLDKSRMGKKTETLEERTARILGIHRRTSADDSTSEKGSGSKKLATNPASSAESKKDLNAYMNNLLTGVASVSPATKQKYLSSDNAQTQGKSPLVTNSVSTNSKVAAPHGKQGVETKNSKQRYPAEELDQESHSSGDEGHANLARASPVSPHGKMLLSYGNNIYAETPGFHNQQRSYDSTESDENSGDDEREPGYKGSSASVRKPSTQKQPSVMPPSRSEGIPDSHDNYDGSPKPSAANLSVWSPSRDVARDKIAKSIGFNLQNVNDPTTHEATSVRISSDEYDIKILTVTGRKTHEEIMHANGEVANSTDSPSSEDGDDDGGLEQVMHSIGLDPSAAWTMSV